MINLSSGLPYNDLLKKMPTIEFEIQSIFQNPVEQMIVNEILRVNQPIRH